MPACRLKIIMLIETSRATTGIWMFTSRITIRHTNAPHGFEKQGLNETQTSMHIEGTIRIVDKRQKRKLCSVIWIYFFLMTTLCWAIHPDYVVIVKAGHGGSNYNKLEVAGTASESCYWHQFLVLVESHGQNILWNPTFVDLMVGIKYTREWGQSNGSKQLADTSCDVPLLKDALFSPWFNRAVKCYAWYPVPCKCTVLWLQLTVVLSVLDSHNEKCNCMCLISFFFFPSPSPEESRSK